MSGNDPGPRLGEIVAGAAFALGLIALRSRRRPAGAGQMNDNDPGPTLGEIIASAAFALGLITAWLYVAGWTYAYYYLDRFRIPLLLVDLPREHLFVYGGLIVRKNPSTAVGVSILLVAAVAALFVFRRQLGRTGITGLLVLGVLVLFLLARLAGTATAAADFALQRGSDYRVYPRVVLETGSVATNAEVAKDPAMVRSGCARLVLASKDRLFLIRPVKGAADLELHTVVVPWSDIKALRITDQYTSCE
jgi:hypothetical protein